MADAAMWVRAASGALFVLAGLCLLAMLLLGRVRERWAALGFAVFLTGAGVAIVAFNLGDRTSTASAAPMVLAALTGWAIAAAGGLVLLAAAFPERRGERALVLLLGALALVAPLAYAAANVAELAGPMVGRLPPGHETSFAVTIAFQRVAAATAVGTACALALSGRSAAPERVRAGALLSLALTAYFAAQNGAFPLTLGGLRFADVFTASFLLALLITALLWLATLERVRTRAALLVALGIPTLVLLGLLFPDPAAPLTGVVRMGSVAVVAVAVLRHGLFGPDLTRRTAHHATRAALGLAAVFITAEIAQNYLSSVYGLLMGGVVAGALLFAAEPLQRALATRGPPGVVPDARAEGDLDARERSFRAAVRMALRDGVLTPAEERELVVLADHLGIRPARAFQLRDEVEKARASDDAGKRNP